MASQRTRKVEVFRLVSRFITILAVIGMLRILIAPAVLAQGPQAGQRHAAPAKSARQHALFNSSDSSLFLPAVTYSSGGFLASSVAVANLRGDGNQDLVVANCAPSGSSNCEGNGSVGVLLGKGDGTFQTVVTYPSGACDTRSVAVADVNGDGRMDVVVASSSDNSHCGEFEGPGTISVLLGNGDGTLQPAVTYSSGGYMAWSVAVEDLNGDGKPDLIVANSCGDSNCDGSVGVLLGNGDGTFRAVVTYASGGAFVSSVAAADLNGDGKPDVVVSNSGSNSVSVLLGNGDGTFQQGVAYSSGGATPESVVVAHVNGDDKSDLIVANYFSGTAGVLLDNGDGSFQSALTYGTGGGTPLWVATADVNGDGKPDLIAANYLSGLVGVLLGNGDGTFQPAVTYSAAEYYLTSVAVADVNGDGKPDLAVGGGYYNGSWGTGSVAVLLNNSAPQNPTTTALASSLSPSVYGQAVTFTAKVTSSSGTPRGTVEILNGTTFVGSGTLVSGSASIPVSALPTGTDSITASYLGASGYATSKSAPLTQTVTVATTTTSLASSIDPAATNQSIVFTATVTGQYGGGAGGSVVFNSGSQTLGTASLIGNVATLATSFSAPGTDSITAKYSGDANNTGSTSTSLTQTVIASTTSSLTSAPNPALIGQAITFTATASSTSGTPPNGELVTFNSGSSVLGTGSLSVGTATLVTSSLPAGVFTITASYPGDATFAASTSPAIRQVVDTTTKSATSTAFTSSLNPSIYGQRVTWTATVTTSGPVPPTGKVNFVWSGYNIGTATLNSSGVAAFTRSNLNADTYPLIAIYVGDANNLRSTSSVVNQVITQATSSATLTSSPNPSSLGEAVTFTATITSPTFIPTGPVTFTAGKTVLGTAQLRGGKAKFTTSTLAVGKTMVKATYAGSSDVTESSATIKQTVQ